MNTNTRPFPSSPATALGTSSRRAPVLGRTLASRASLGDPRFGRIDSGFRTRLWNQAMIDRLQSPLTRYHD